MTGNGASDTRTIAELIAAHEPGYSLERRFYTDPAVYALELERIVYRNWILAGHVSEFARPGDFRTFDVADESAIIVRSEDDRIRAFANVCRHRGSLVCTDRAGRAKKFRCPYHGWVYDLRGQLTHARDMPASFDRKEHGLGELPCETLHGLVFVSFAPDPPALANCREDLAGPMQTFGFETLRVAASRDYEFDANWKLAIENYQECYHCATAHPEYARMHTLMLDRKKREQVQDSMRERMEECGVRDVRIDFIDTAARPGEIGYGYSRTALFEGYLTGSRDGRPVAPLLGSIQDYDGGASDFSFGAFSFLLAYSDHVVSYVFTPVTMDRSRCRISWLVRDDAEAGRDYDVGELTWLWDVTTRADKTIVANNASGIRSRWYRPGPFARMEQAESNYVEWLLAELQRPAQ